MRWLLRHEPLITLGTVFVLALLLMGQLDALVP